MTGKASKMTKPKAAADMSQREILEALAGTGDTARRSGKNREVPEGDPRTWKFGRMTIELLQAYENFIPRENVPTDDEEHYCSCSGADDGRPMIECSNGNHCLFNWFHLECIGMAQHEIPGDNGMSDFLRPIYDIRTNRKQRTGSVKTAKLTRLAGLGNGRRSLTRSKAGLMPNVSKTTKSRNLL